MSNLAFTQRLQAPHPLVMGILNMTPDSFSDGGRFVKNNRINLDAMLRSVAAMVDAGADMIDVGGESTRPGATPVSEQEEADRVLPVIDKIRAHFDVFISVDTSTPRIISESAKIGCHLINDVRALTRDGALEAANPHGGCRRCALLCPLNNLNTVQYDLMKNH